MSVTSEAIMDHMDLENARDIHSRTSSASAMREIEKHSKSDERRVGI